MLEDALLSAGLLIVVAKLAEGILQRFRLNSIVAYTATGILLGPMTGIVELNSYLQILLSIGIFLYFFLIGLDELDVSAFMAAIHRRYFVAAVISVVIPILACLAVTSDLIFDFGLGLSFGGSLALAGVLSLTSLGIVAKVLIDADRLRQPVGLEMFTVALIAELIVLLIIGFTIGEHASHVSLEGVLLLLGQITAFIVATWVLAGRVMPPLIELLERLLRVPQLSFGLILGLLFIAVVGAEEMGLHGSLGALLLGVSLSGLPHQVHQDIIPGMKSVADGFFVPLFFSAAGLHLSLSFTELEMWTIAAVIVVPLIGNFAGAWLGASAARLDMPFTMAAGLMAKGVAEIAVLLVLLEKGVIGSDIFSLFVLIMLAYILVTPPAISFAVSRAKPAEPVSLPRPVAPSMIHFALDDVTVSDVIGRNQAYPGPELSVREFADRWIVPGQQDYVVTDRDGFVGIVSLAMLRYLPKHAWSNTPLSRITRATTPNTWVDELVEDALQLMVENSLTAIPVMDRESKAFVGAITSQEILHLITAEIRGSR